MNYLVISLSISVYMYIYNICTCILIGITLHLEINLGKIIYIWYWEFLTKNMVCLDIYSDLQFCDCRNCKCFFFHINLTHLKKVILYIYLFVAIVNAVFSSVILDRWWFVYMKPTDTHVLYLELAMSSLSCCISFFRFS